eukprot:10334753-Alexandrium_andersonii.AAC.1
MARKSVITFPRAFIWSCCRGTEHNDEMHSPSSLLSPPSLQLHANMCNPRGMRAICWSTRLLLP